MTRVFVIGLVIGLVVVVVGAFLVTLFTTRVPQERPYVEVLTTRCLRPDGQPVGEEYGQPCPSGTTPDTVVIQSHLPSGD